jgi:hypothetical protein
MKQVFDHSVSSVAQAIGVSEEEMLTLTDSINDFISILIPMQLEGRKSEVIEFIYNFLSNSKMSDLHKSIFLSIFMSFFQDTLTSSMYALQDSSDDDHCKCGSHSDKETIWN